MTEQEIYNTYGIEFRNRIFDFDEFGKQIVKDVNATNGSLYRFLNDWESVSDIDNDLLPVVEGVLNDVNKEDVSGSETEWVELNFNTTKIFYTGNPHDDDNPDCELPTEHFKIIILGWRNFLLQPPFDRTKVRWYSNLSAIPRNHIRQPYKIPNAQPFRA